MGQVDRTISVPYEDYKALKKDADDKASALAIISAEFPDDACRMIALKSVLGYEEPDSEPDPDPEPTPDPDPTPDPEPTPDPDNT